MPAEEFCSEVVIEGFLTFNDMTFSNSQVISWRKEYLQELKDTLLKAASNNYLEQILEKTTPEETAEEIGEDGLACFEFLFLKFIPFLSFLIFHLKNNPLADKGSLAEMGRYPRYDISEVFDFISGMTNYGKYHVVNQFPGDDDSFKVLQKAVFSNEKEVFLEIAKDRDVDFTDLRQRISLSMFAVSSLEELIQLLCDYFDRMLSDDEDGDDDSTNEDKEIEVAKDSLDFMFDHLSSATRQIAESAKKAYLDLLGLGDTEEVDRERLHILSELRFPDDWLWGQFLATAFEFGLMSLVMDECLTESEFAIVNAFFDDPRTNRILNEMEKSMFVLSDGEFCPQKMFIPHPLRETIESGAIKELIRRFDSGSIVREEPEDQAPQTIQEKGSEAIEDNPSDEELNSNSPLVLPSDFFSNDSYIDENIHTIGNLPDWVRNAPASQFAQMINYLAGEDHGYIDPSLGNRRLLASILSGRKLKTNRSQVQWIEIMDREQSKTEKVILWLCQFLYGGRYAEAYKVFGRERTILAGSETAYIKYADRTLQERIEVLYPQRTPHRLKTQKEPK